jgi:DNA-binding GntR family transcriptional regulator
VLDPRWKQIAEDLRLGTGNGRLGSGGAALSSQDQPSSRDVTVSRPTVGIPQAVTTEVGRELDLEADATVVRRHQQRFIDGVAWSLQTTFYPMSLVDRGALRLMLEEDIPEGAVQYLEDTLGIKEVGWRVTFIVRPPDMAETAFFDLSEVSSTAVVEITRTGFAETGRPLRVTVTTYLAYRNRFVMITGQVPSDER